ncbi:Phytanoyl-CoA dioxygenase domain-containing protein 1 [Halotydeus destructor]|nr:Phytanoyl-CoA dioxygenase domain-containing protein 1 [Halotydeus destructor]
MDLESVSRDYRDKGYAILPDFLADVEVSRLLDEIDSLVTKSEVDIVSIFETGANQSGDKYFVESGDKIRFFFEKQALAPNGQLEQTVRQGLNKVGHALHWLNPVYKQVTFSDKVKQLVRHVAQFERPTVPQSMFIYKNPTIGGQVVAHQDASFLHTEPTIKLMGIWIALEDATIENGCLWFVPGSQADGLKRRFIRNPDGDQPPLIFTNEAPNYPDDAFVAEPVKKGTCVLIDGLVVHKSEANLSQKWRPAYTFHVIDESGTEWSAGNWLQPSPQLPFPSLFDN